MRRHDPLKYGGTVHTKRHTAESKPSPQVALAPQTPLPNVALTILHAVGKATERQRRFHRLSPISDRRRTLPEAVAASHSRSFLRFDASYLERCGPCCRRRICLWHGCILQRTARHGPNPQLLKGLVSQSTRIILPHAVNESLTNNDVNESMN